MKKKKKIDLAKLKPEELKKYEVAKELGLFDKVMSEGWGALTARETGRIGGILKQRADKAKKAQENSEISE